MNIIVKCILVLAVVQLAQSCNRRYTKIVDREIDPVNRTKYPWLVAIKAKHQSRYQLRLSYGSLIHPKAVLTAAISIKGYDSNTLIVQTQCQPSSSFGKEKELLLRHCINRDVTKSIYSKNYNWQNPSQNDFAILILNEAFEIGDEINVINLARSVEDINHSNCVYVRWMREFSMTDGKRELVIASYKTSYHNGLFSTEDFDSEQLISDRDWIIGQDFHALNKVSHRNALNFMGSPLACQLNRQQTYVQVGIGTFNMVIFLQNDDKSIDKIQQEGSLIDIIHQRDDIMQLLSENVEIDSFISTIELPRSTSPRSTPSSIPESVHISTPKPLAPNYVYSSINREQADRNFKNSFTCCKNNFV